MEHMTNAASPRTPHKRTRDCNALPQSPTSPQFQLLGTAVPVSVIRKIQNELGATVTRECGITSIIFHEQRGPAHETYEEFVRQLPDAADPLVFVGGPAHSMAAQYEAASIVQHYAPLRASDFHTSGGVPQIPPPVAMVGGGIRYNGMMALSAVPSRIAAPQDTLYPTIMGIPRGGIICHLTVMWAKGTAVTHVITRS